MTVECTHENQENLKHNKNQTCLGCEKERPCQKWFYKLFMINHMAYKVCLKSYDKIKNLPDINSFFF